MEQNKTGKYFKYAFGEIVLVVIGILIALQISNWNEGRKQVNTQNAIYQVIKEDLETDIVQFESFIKEYIEIRQPVFETVLNKELTKEDWKSNPIFSQVISGYEDIGISQRGTNLLKGLSSLTDNLEKNLASNINAFYNEHLVEVNIAVEELSNQFERNYAYFQNFGWLAAYLMNNDYDGFIDSFYNDPSMKSKIAVYYLTFKIYATELQSYVSDAKILISDIDNYLK